MSDIWNAKVYSQFLDLRTLPARDLLAGVPASLQTKVIYDLGCGPGNSTAVLKERYPQARIIGIDNSLDMLDQARKTCLNVEFIEGDVSHFSPPEKIDLLFSNATLQWINQHEILLPGLLKTLNKEGVFAFQMPNNFHSPSHQTAIKLLQNNSVWKNYLKDFRYGLLTKPFYNVRAYYDLLTQAGAIHLRIWETEYLQEMSDHQAIFDWMKGTGLRPVLYAMSEDMQVEFASAYVNAIKNDYPLQANGKVLLPYRRMFIVGLIG